MKKGQPKMEKKIYRLVPAVRDYLWGGTRLIEKYGKTTVILEPVMTPLVSILWTLW